MGYDRIKVVIAYGDSQRAHSIKNMLPDYADGFLCGFGDEAKKAISIDMNGKYPDLVVLDGDDQEQRGLEIFEWMRKGESSLKKHFIPVLVLTEDEFSEEAEAFLDIDDVVFCEGDFSEDEFFSSFVEALDMTQAAGDEETEEPPVEEKSPERIMGKAVKAAAGSARTAVLSDSERLCNLAKAIERGRQQVEEIRVIEAEKRGEKYERKYTSHDRLYGPLPEYIYTEKKADPKPFVDDEDIPEEFRLGSKQSSGRKTESETAVKEQNQQNKSTTQNNTKAGAEMPQPVNNKEKATIVVVDDHEFIRKMFEMILSDRYNVVSLSSGMQAVDYFVKNTADVIFMDAVMPGMTGLNALNSIRWHNNGKTVPCVFLVGKDYRGSAQDFKGSYVCGTLPKPISKGAILTAVAQLKLFIKKL